MDAGEYGRTRGTCFVARRLEVVAVAGLLWILWCVLGAAGFCAFFRFFFFERTPPAAGMRPPCLVYFSTSNESFFPIEETSFFIPGCVQGTIILLSVAMCVSVRV